MASHLKGKLKPEVKKAMKLIAEGKSYREAAKLAGCSFGGISKAMGRKRKEAQK